MAGRDDKGRFVKGGASPNPKGRPKKSKEPEVDSKKITGDPMKDLVHLLKTAKSRTEVFKYAKELLPYTNPKLSSVQSEIKEEKTVTITIEGFKKPIDITPEKKR